MKIIKFIDSVSVQKCTFIKKCFSCNSCVMFNSVDALATGKHNHQTRVAINGLLILSSCNASKFGTKAFLYSAITPWNSFKTLLKDYPLSLYIIFS